MSFSKIEKIILVFAGALILFGFGFLFSVNDDDSITTAGNMPSIGSVVNYANDSRRRMSNAGAWYQTKKQELVFNNDSFFTGPSSSLEIKLEDGSILKLGPNSLIVLTKTNKTPSLELRAGTMRFNSGIKQDIEIKSKGKVITLKPNEANSEVEITKSGSDEIQVVSNNGVVQIDDGKNQVEVSEDKQITLSIPKEQDVEKSFLIAEAPRSPVTSTTLTRTTFPFTLPEDPKEDAVIRNETATPTTSSPQPAPAPPTPVAVSPIDGAEIILIESSTVTVVFEWEAAQDSSFELQVAKDKQFKSDLRTLKSEAPLTFLDFAAENQTYYWRIRSFQKNRSSEWSEMRLFSLKKN